MKMEISEKEAIKEFEVLSFIVGDQEMAFDVDYVEIVIDKVDPTPVPKSKPMIKGIINLRGRIVPIIDLADVLGSYVDESQYESIVVVKYNEIEAGFMVGTVKGVLRTSTAEIENMASLERYGEKSKGLIKKGSRLIVYLDVTKIIDEIAGEQ